MTPTRLFRRVAPRGQRSKQRAGVVQKVAVMKVNSRWRPRRHGFLQAARFWESVKDYDQTAATFVRLEAGGRSLATDPERFFTFAERLRFTALGQQM